MRTLTRAAVGIVVGLAAVGLVAGCGKAGSPGTTSHSAAASGGCAPVAGPDLVLLADDKKLESAENIIPAVNAKAADDALMAALNKVSAAVGPQQLTALNRATSVDRKAPQVVATEFASSVKLTQGITKGTGAKITIATVEANENQTIGELYKIVLTAAGYDAAVQQIPSRDVYEPLLERDVIQVVPEYTGTLTEYLNTKLNGSGATPKVSGDSAQTTQALTDLGAKVGLAFGKPAAAANQNAFAVTKATATKYSLASLSDFAAKCAGSATVLGGPAACPKETFCQKGLEQTYGAKFGPFKTLDAGGPETLQALRDGQITIGLVFSSDAAFATS